MEVLFKYVVLILWGVIVIVIGVRRINKMSIKIFDIELNAEMSASQKKEKISKETGLMRGVYFAGVLLTLLSAVLLAPYFSNFFCKYFESTKQYDLDVVVYKIGESSEKLPVTDAIIEVNGNSSHPKTNSLGESNLKLESLCSKFPGCHCSDVLSVEFSVIYNGSGGKKLVSKHVDEFRKAWLNKDDKDIVYELLVD